MQIKRHVEACREEYHPDLYKHLNDGKINICDSFKVIKILYGKKEYNFNVSQSD